MVCAAHRLLPGVQRPLHLACFIEVITLHETYKGKTELEGRNNLKGRERPHSKKRHTTTPPWRKAACTSTKHHQHTTVCASQLPDPTEPRNSNTLNLSSRRRTTLHHLTTSAPDHPSSSPPSTSTSETYPTSAPQSQSQLPTAQNREATYEERPNLARLHLKLFFAPSIFSFGDLRCISPLTSNSAQTLEHKLTSSV